MANAIKTCAHQLGQAGLRNVRVAGYSENWKFWAGSRACAAANTCRPASDIWTVYKRCGIGAGRAHLEYLDLLSQNQCSHQWSSSTQ